MRLALLSLALLCDTTLAQQAEKPNTGGVNSSLQSLLETLKADQNSRIATPKGIGKNQELESQKSLLFKGNAPAGEFVVVPAAAANDLLSKQTNAISALSERLAKIEERLEAMEKIGRSK